MKIDLLNSKFGFQIFNAFLKKINSHCSLQILWKKFLDKIQGKANYVCRRFSESQPMAIIDMFASFCCASS
jgi:hypothetical protein